ncbi:MAG TPA: nickel pincer cofactor biosynthesis protein LarC [Coriobacteriia bacterium]|nr:nickel pincer cofactor biosynthesis protein LarC [Coriobacteriia bacterium]
MIAYLDCSTGVSGDKFLGALLDAGAQGAFTVEHLQAVLDELAPEGRVVADRVHSRGIGATSVRVEVSDEPHSRTWATIREMLASASLPEHVRERAMEAFGELARAEALAHDTDVDSVHFHEVGAVDSIMDVVGVCLGMYALGITDLVVSPIAVGGGFVDTSHGVLPVPAPATAAILVGLPTIPGPVLPDGSAPGELTTPTGAALVRACASRFGGWPAMLPHLVGYGAGTRDIGSPNICRLVIGTPVAVAPQLEPEIVTLLETNIDHLSPEAAAFTVEQLLAEGALDAWTSPIVMKKGRSAYTLSVLADLERAEHFAQRVVSLTGTLGIRRRDLERLIASREQRSVETPYGIVRYKLGAGIARPEADDVTRIAALEGRSFSDVEEELLGFLPFAES